MIAMIVSPPAGLPEDARAVARMTLTSLGTQLERALARGGERLDPYTRAHLTDSPGADRPGARRAHDPALMAYWLQTGNVDIG